MGGASSSLSSLMQPPPSQEQKAKVADLEREVSQLTNKMLTLQHENNELQNSNW